MKRFWFAHVRGEEIHNSGSLVAGTLPEALRCVARRGLPSTGDRLDIGMEGFPPARYECVFQDVDVPLAWRLVNQMN